jgi:hypothetical protein
MSPIPCAVHFPFELSVVSQSGIILPVALPFHCSSARFLSIGTLGLFFSQARESILFLRLIL